MDIEKVNYIGTRRKKLPPVMEQQRIGRVMRKVNFPIKIVVIGGKQNGDDLINVILPPSDNTAKI